MNKNKNIGIFSGTFDPFHEGHLKLCLSAIHKCQLNEVVVLIEKKPLHKIGVSNYDHRKSMIELALENHQNINILDINANNITIDDVLPALNGLYVNAEYWFIAGSDVLINMSNWSKVDKLFRSMGLCIANRNNHSQEQDKLIVNDLQRRFGKIKYRLLPEVSSDVSSSLVRKQISDYSESSLLHPEVLDYIKTQQLYKY